MSENVSNGAETDFDPAAQLDRVFEDEALRSLDINSDEFKAALSGESKTEAEVAEDDSMSADDVEEDDEVEEETPEQPAKKPRGMLKRIEKLVAEKRDLERELEQLRGSKPKDIDEAVAEATPYEFDVPKPKMTDFDTMEDYTDALTDWKLDKREFERRMEAERTNLVEKAKSIQTSWEQREAEVKKQIADYADVVTVKAVAAAAPSQEAKVFITSSEHGPTVMYEVLKDAETVKKFAEMSPVAQVAYLAKVEARLEGASTEKTTSAAPKVPANTPRTLKPTKSVAAGKDLIKNLEDMSDAEWLRQADDYFLNKKRKR